MKFVDTNVFLRYLTGDDSTKARACRALIERVHAGEDAVTTSESVIAEIVLVLRSKRLYDVPPAQVRDVLAPIIAMPALELDHKRAVLRALDLMATLPALDFEDALSAQHMLRQGIVELYSYDADFDAISDVTRIEPSPPTD